MLTGEINFNSNNNCINFPRKEHTTCTNSTQFTLILDVHLVGKLIVNVYYRKQLTFWFGNALRDSSSSNILTTYTTLDYAEKLTIPYIGDRHHIYVDTKLL